MKKFDSYHLVPNGIPIAFAWSLIRDVSSQKVVDVLLPLHFSISDHVYAQLLLLRQNLLGGSTHRFFVVWKFMVSSGAYTFQNFTEQECLCLTAVNEK